MGKFHYSTTPKNSLFCLDRDGHRIYILRYDTFRDGKKDRRGSGEGQRT
jgi:hypothetical protein